MRVLRKALVFLVAASFGLSLSACEGPTPSPDGRPDAGEPPRSVARAAPATSEAAADVPIGAPVTLAVHDADGNAVVGREVRLLDARGALARGLTDEEGGVVLEGVVKPYDLAVEGSPSTPSGGVPTIVVGLTNPYAVVVLDEHDPTPPPPAQSFVMALALGARPPGGGLRVQVASTSAHGAGVSEIDVGGDASTVVVTHVHPTRFAVGSDGERVRLHVLARDARGAAFRHALVEAGESAPGEVHDLGVVALGEPAVEGRALEVTRTGDAPIGGPSATAATLRFDDGTVFPLGRAEAETGSFVVPDLPAARVCVAAWAERPHAAGADLHAGARSERCLPVGGGAFATVGVPLASPLGLAYPAAGGVLSRRGGGLRLAGGEGPRVARVTLVDELRGAVCARVVTGGTELSFDALARLGVPRLEPGPHVVDIDAVLDTTVDAETSPRRTKPDERRWTSRRVRVTVTR